MRKEIIGIFCFFLVIFTLISLLSFSPDDPSIHNAKASGEIHNLFGRLGAHLAGVLIGIFGLGAFWIPLLLLLTSIHFFGDHPTKAKISTLIGGILLVVTTGSLLAVRHRKGRDLGVEPEADPGDRLLPDRVGDVASDEVGACAPGPRTAGRGRRG